jgi:hypothetical protein
MPWASTVCPDKLRREPLGLIATVYPEVYPSDMPPILARLEPSHEYIRPHKCVWYLTLLVFRVLCILVFWELYPPIPLIEGSFCVYTHAGFFCASTRADMTHAEHMYDSLDQ